jgi:5-methylcytosine-specific restriction protein B
MAVRRTSDKVRSLSADDLGIGVQQTLVEHVTNRPDDPGLSDNDPLLREVLTLLESYGGVIFSGPPGTSKTWYAQAIGEWLADRDEARYRMIQFHPSYQYEDFVEGYVPRKDGSGFELQAKHFVAMCDAAKQDSGRRYVLVIDELSRGDPGRIFGEALTYVEHSKRGREFFLASGRPCVVPPNLVILATMNPLDRGVDEVDAAFERRFAKIAMEPSEAILNDFLVSNNVDEALSRDVRNFFRTLQRHAARTPQAAVGHTFFRDVTDVESVRAVWRYQLRFLIDKAYRLEPATGEEVRQRFTSLFGEDPPAPGGREDVESPEPTPTVVQPDSIT